MPKYKRDMNRIINKKDVDLMLSRADLKQHKFLVAFLYLTGARPSEIVALRRKDFELYHDRVDVLLSTKKGGLPRTIQLWVDAPYVKDVIIPYIEYIDQTEADRMFTFESPVWVLQLIYRFSDNEFCPYNFRHSRLTKMAKAGAGPFELMIWKGAKRFDSIRPYIMHSPPPREKAILYLR